MRFNGPELGAWCAADDIRTAAAEVGTTFDARRRHAI
jgi:hypothetical protein